MAYQHLDPLADRTVLALEVDSELAVESHDWRFVSPTAVRVSVGQDVVGKIHYHQTFAGSSYLLAVVADTVLRQADDPSLLFLVLRRKNVEESWCREGGV